MPIATQFLEPREEHDHKAWSTVQESLGRVWIPVQKDRDVGQDPSMATMLLLLYEIMLKGLHLSLA